MTATTRWDGQWLAIIEDLLVGDGRKQKAARDTMWSQTLQYIAHSVRLDIGPLSDDGEVRREIAYRVLGKLEANNHAHIREWMDRQRRGTDGCSWWGFIKLMARRCAIDYARTCSLNVARRGEPFQWVRVEPEDPAVLADRLESSSELLRPCSEPELYHALVQFQASHGTISSDPPPPPPSVPSAMPPTRPRRDRS
jgi:hypothetical protein